MSESIEFENSEKYHQQQSDAGRSRNFIDQELKLAIKRGDWNELENMPVALDGSGRSLIRFNEDRWQFNNYFKSEGLCNLDFEIINADSDKYRSLTINQLKAENILRNQIKCYVLALMYYVAFAPQHRTIQTYLNQCKRLARFMLENGVYSLHGLNMSDLRRFVASGFEFTEVTIAAINVLNKSYSYLPFALDLDVAIKPRVIGITLKEKEQYVVIPPRIYMGLLQNISERVGELYRHRDVIESAVRKMLDDYDQIAEKLFNSIRNGLSTGSTYIADLDMTRSAFNRAGVPIVDEFKNERWIGVWIESGSRLIFPGSKMVNQSYEIGGIRFDSISQLKDYLFHLDNQCKYLCLALSGMRVDELYGMSPIWGAQVVEVEGQKIHLFTTRQSKITPNSQTKNDVYVTTETGYKAYGVLNAIHSPLRERFLSEQERFFGSIIMATNKCEAMKKTGVNNGIRKEMLNNAIVDLTLTQDDIRYLQISDPANNNFKVGDLFVLHNHSLRRSLAYYLIGYELMSFPQLKQQFSHYSMAMTRWYARNSSSFKKMHTEIDNERVIQQATIFERIYQKMANNERIAGGKGKAVLKEISKQGPNYFEEKDNNRKLSAAYWQKELKGKTAHLHAIAPGMYCTNEQCSMRINIELAECADCAFDYIEDVAYAETARVDAMRNLLLAEESGVLNKSLASKYLMQIRAAEKIMDDLGFEYESFEVPESAKQLLMNVYK